jgi:hypothetical protein
MQLQLVPERKQFDFKAILVKLNVSPRQCGDQPSVNRFCDDTLTACSSIVSTLSACLPSTGF